MPKDERLVIKVPRAYKVAIANGAAAEGEAVAVFVRRILRVELERRYLLQAANGRD